MELLADTHVLIWYVLSAEKLSVTTRERIEAETSAGRRVAVSSHALVEIAYATEKGRDPLTADEADAIVANLRDEESPFEVVPVDLNIGERVRSVPRVDNSDPGDRIVVATAEVLGLSIVSADRKIPLMTSQPVIW